MHMAQLVAVICHDVCDIEPVYFQKLLSDEVELL
jgi:hypothetical protein